MTNKSIVKPNFIIIGSPKCGTTSLFKYLSQHPKIEFSDRKEPKFFCWKDLDLNFSGNSLVLNQIRVTTVQDRQEYLDLFKNKTADFIGEGSVDYFHSRNTAEKIFDFNPNMKLILILRNPIDRAYSDWKHNVKMGYENIKVFRNAIKAITKRKKNNGVPYFDYLHKGNYASHLKEYLSYFGHDKVLVLFFEDFQKDPGKTCNEILHFLGEKKSFDFNTEIVFTKSGEVYRYYKINSLAKKITSLNKRTGDKIRSVNRIPEKISMKDRFFLTDYYRQEIKELEAILDKDLAHWLN